MAGLVGCVFHLSITCFGPNGQGVPVFGPLPLYIPGKLMIIAIRMGLSAPVADRPYFDSAVRPNEQRNVWYEVQVLYGMLG